MSHEELVDSVQTVDVALYELCCASNSRISPADLGFEYLDNKTYLQAQA